MKDGLPPKHSYSKGDFEEAASKTSNVDQILSGLTEHRVNSLLVEVTSIRYVDEEAIATVKDNSGCIDACIHRDAIEEMGTSLRKGTKLMCTNVAIVNVDEESKPFLIFLPENINFVESSAHMEISDTIEAESESEEVCVIQYSNENAEFDVDTASKELRAMSQHMVINRNPPTENIWAGLPPKKSLPTLAMRKHISHVPHDRSGEEFSPVANPGSHESNKVSRNTVGSLKRPNNSNGIECLEKSLDDDW